MPKAQHEIRDPIHNFIRVEGPERAVLDSRPFQRLRHIHQLAMAYLVYPGATHRRFEHSLGVMELAGRVFDVITNPNNLTDKAREVQPPNPADLLYWRRVVRMAALCHDIGHLPFSHAAEKELLPAGWKHERLTDDLIRGGEMAPHWKALKVDPDDVAKLAIGAKTFAELRHRTVEFTSWEAILAEIIVGDAFGVDRMDYLLRDSYHTGVAYGKFDHYRLIDTLRILAKPGSNEPALGIEAGGLHSAEALLLARYFMYSQVYFHHTRRAYDYHLTEFLKSWLPGGRFPTDPEEHLARTDNEVLVAMRATTRDPSAPGHEHASRIATRNHYRLLYSRNPEDMSINRKAGEAIAVQAAERYGPRHVYSFTYTEKSSPLEFPVLYPDGRIGTSLSASTILPTIPPVSVGYVYIDPNLKDEAERWLRENRSVVITPKSEGP